MTTTEVENYPGFAQAIMGPDLMAEMRTQAERFGAELRAEDVESVDLTGPIKYVTVNGTRHAAKAVVLAMGAAARYLHVPGEQKLLGHGGCRRVPRVTASSSVTRTSRWSAVATRRWRRRRS